MDIETIVKEGKKDTIKIRDLKTLISEMLQAIQNVKKIKAKIAPLIEA